MFKGPEIENAWCILEKKQIVVWQETCKKKKKPFRFSLQTVEESYSIILNNGI